MKKASKGKGRRKKKVPQTPVEDEEEKLTEEQFKAIVVEQEEKYEKLKSECIALENENQKNYEKLKELDEDRKDIIEHLNSEIKRKENELTVEEGYVTVIQQERKENTHYYNEKITFLQNELKAMKEHFKTETQHLQSKIHAYDELRLQRDDLMKKFQIQEKQILEQVTKQKEILYETERKFIIAKDQLTKEMEEKLFNLGQEFQKITTIRIAALCQEAVKENVILNNKVTEMMQLTKKLLEENEILSKNLQMNKIKLELYMDESNVMLSKSDKQHKRIDTLAGSHKKMVEKYGWMESHINHAKQMKEKTKQAKEILCQNREKLEILKKQLHEAETGESKSRRELEATRDYINNLHKIVRDSVKGIKEVIKIDEDTDDITEKEMMLKEALKNLRKLLFTIESLPESYIKSLLSEVSTEQFLSNYALGDLGLVPTMGSAELHLIYDSSLYTPFMTGKDDIPKETESSVSKRTVLSREEYGPSQVITDDQLTYVSKGRTVYRNKPPVTELH